MKIAYVTTFDAKDITNWSGLPFYLASNLKKNDVKLIYVGPLKKKISLLAILLKWYYRLCSNLKYTDDREPTVLRYYAKQVSKKLKDKDYDLILSPGTIPISYLDVKKPIIFWTDATFEGMRDYYPGFTNLCRRSIKNGNNMEQRSLDNCRFALYSTEWAAKSAITNYDVDEDKVKVVHFGANIDDNRTIDDIKNLTKKKLKSKICKLLFIGVEWERKGGPIAVEVVKILNKKGVKSELHIVGCNPQIDNKPDYIKIYGFINKNTKTGKLKLEKLFSESHFFILPTQAECSALVLSESNSFGVPALTTKTGGLSDIVIHGVNGGIFPVNAGPEEYSNFIKKYMKNYQDYKKLALTSFDRYLKEFCWNITTKKLLKILEEARKDG